MAKEGDEGAEKLRHIATQLETQLETQLKELAELESALRPNI